MGDNCTLGVTVPADVGNGPFVRCRHCRFCEERGGDVPAQAGKQGTTTDRSTVAVNGGDSAFARMIFDVGRRVVRAQCGDSFGDGVRGKALHGSGIFPNLVWPENFTHGHVTSRQSAGFVDHDSVCPRGFFEYVGTGDDDAVV